MITAPLPPEEYWLYRVFSELTLSLLHKVNNELTGVVFQVENLQELVEAGEPIEECSADLGLSLAEVLGLLRHSASLQREPEERPQGGVPFSSLLTLTAPVLRLILPKSLHLIIPSPSSDPWIYLTEEDFIILVAAIGLQLHPPGSHPCGEFNLRPVTAGEGWASLHLSMQGDRFSTSTLLEPSSAAWAAVSHRLHRLGCQAELPGADDQDFLTIHFPTTPRL
jgi:hypothetical protein